MTPKQQAELAIRQHLIIESNLLYEYAIHTDLEEIKLDRNFKKAVDHAILETEATLKAIDWHEFETPNDQIQYFEEVKQELLNLK